MEYAYACLPCSCMPCMYAKTATTAGQANRVSGPDKICERKPCACAEGFRPQILRAASGGASRDRKGELAPVYVAPPYRRCSGPAHEHAERFNCAPRAAVSTVRHSAHKRKEPNKGKSLTGQKSHHAKVSRQRWRVLAHRHCSQAQPCAAAEAEQLAYASPPHHASTQCC